ncbi:class I SAM-dependent methyltransferase [Novosphingobium album (ex Liu et al. 2023)]|uniref:Class I SAM-dependent methyltransferase n=1 Tax=Novosphingobium album (ex Liu et al. 2023) TaxID=3031130 RepID=A0ABT5WVY6_9SPHN|nr:class I SAM-dependent methyltransferase [Novosphingobium album (ex Liu et al. 2023)]MDE8654043.1 class I SAM-dependent methyltransferase [Novosphingobium album (ex Liu et al. 2023)]
MTENPSAADWAEARGRKWRDQLDAMETMLLPVDAPLIAALALEGASSVADIGCGGGATTRAIADAAPAGCRVTGIDISADLVAAASARAGTATVSFRQADAETWRPDAPFDRLSSRFGIMFFPDPPAAFANLRRWLAPGGRFAFAAWGTPQANPWMSSVRQTIGEVIALAPPPADAPGPLRYGDAGRLVALLERAGFAAITVTPWSGKLALGGGLDAAAACEFALGTMSVGELLDDAPPAARTQARERLTARFAEHLEDGVVRMGASVNIFTGTVN